MFDVGMAEVVVIGGAAILLLGKNDMPLVFRLVGRGVGKVSGLVQAGRSRMSELSQGSDLMQLQNEIRSNLDDLRVIKAELRGAAQLTPGITNSSHPGSSALRDQALPGAPSLPPPSGVAPASTRLAINTPGMRTVPRSLPTATTPGAQGGPVSGSGGIGGGGAFSGGVRDMPSPAASVSGIGGSGGSAVGGGGAMGSAGLGLSAPVPPRPSGQRREAVQSVASPGSDRLQRLAMAEIGFAEKEMYAPKTDSLPGGADILNEAITDSLLQERYRQMLSVARRGTGESEGGNVEGSKPPR
ncbi:unnamed protein product [Scytosiphon promiscuus]